MPGRYRVRVPASTANLGPGFDVIGCALNLFLELEAAVLEDQQNTVMVQYEGVSADMVPLDRSNLVVQSMIHLVYRMQQGQRTSEEDVPYEIVQLPRSFSLHVRNDIPLSRGLGSSAAAIVGGMVLANVLFDYNLCKDALMDYILELENHPDNVGASLMGGLIAGFVRTDQERSQPQDNALKRFKCGYARWQWNTSIRAVCVIPDFTLSTKKARQVLPTHYTRADCVFNLQRLAVLVPALTAPQLDPELVHDILTDRLHQDYRKTLIPGLSQVLSDMTPRRVPGLLGVVLSGAGPTILALASSNFNAIADQIQQILSNHDIVSEYKLLEQVEQGTTVEIN